MRLRHRVALNGNHLDEVDERIVITGVEEAAGREQITAAASGHNGQRITGRRRDPLNVTVRFRLWIRKNDMAARAELLEKVNAWAADGGALFLNYKPQRRLTVTLTQAPGLGDPWNWTDEFEMVFTAYAVPYWQDWTAVTVQTSTGTERNATIEVPGSAETVMEATVWNRSGAKISTLTVTCGSSVIDLAGLDFGAGEKIVINHSHTAGKFVLRIRQGTDSSMKSILAKRKPESSDDLYVNPGSVACNVKAQRAIQAEFSVRGRYL